MRVIITFIICSSTYHGSLCFPQFIKNHLFLRKKKIAKITTIQFLRSSNKVPRTGNTVFVSEKIFKFHLKRFNWRIVSRTNGLPKYSPWFSGERIYMRICISNTQSTPDIPVVNGLHTSSFCKWFESLQNPIVNKIIWTYYFSFINLK